MKSLSYLLLIFTSLVLLACGPDTPPKTKLFEEQRNALDKAKAVDSAVQKQAEETRKNIDKETQ